MKKYSLTAVFFILFISNSLAQDSLSYHSKENAGITCSADPVLMIKGDEIRRFPANNFVEAVEGLFPWVFGAGQRTDEFLYVLNGRVLASIDAINLNDIESVSFTRNNLYGGLFPFSKAGTFFIVTKTAAPGKLVVNFNAQFNIVSNGQQLYLPVSGYPYGYSKVLKNQVNNNQGNYLSNHISVSGSGKKYSFYTAGYFNSNQFPASNQSLSLQSQFDTTTRHIDAGSKGKQQAYGMLLDGTYQFSSTLQSGISFNYSHRQITRDSAVHQTITTYISDDNRHLSAPVNQFYVSAFVKWQPNRQLSDRFSVEYTKNNYELKRHGESAALINGSSYTSRSEESLAYKSEGILIRNELGYQLKSKGPLKASVYLNSLWYKPTSEVHDTAITVTGNGGYNAQAYFYKATEKIAVVNPAFHFSYNNIINGYAGLGYLIGKKQFQYVKNSDKINVYAGVDLNLQSIFSPGKSTVLLNLSFNYSKMAMNSSFAPVVNEMVPFAAAFLSSFNYNNNTGKANLFKNELMSVKLTAGLLKSRLLFAAEWSRLKYDKIFIYQVIGFPGTYYSYVADYETAKGISFVISATIVDKKNLQFYSRINLLVPETKSHAPYSNAINYIEERSIKAGLQNKLVYRQLFLQANVLMNFNHLYPATSAAGKAEKKNDLVLNYLLLGYNAPASAKGILKNSVLFIQARNLFVSGALRELYLYNRFAGIGINLML